MFRKVLVGLLAVAIGLAIAGAGYRFGQYLAQKDAASPAVRATSGWIAFQRASMPRWMTCSPN